jgi:hypothetical protein
MNYSEALSFTFRDQSWLKKMAIGGLIAFISLYAGLFFITGFFIMGYYIGILRNVMKEEDRPLPEWSDLGKIFVDGILGGIIFILYFIIIGLISAIPITQVAMDPYILGVEKGLTIAVISMITLLALYIFINIGLMQFAATNNFASAFNMSGLFRLLKGNFGNFLAIVIFSLILNGILFLAGLGIISPFTNFWGLVVQAHLFGQCARNLQETTTVVQSA